MEIDVLQLLGSYAFPIVACIVMAYYVKYTTDKQREDLRELNRLHTEEMKEFKDKLQETINNNTLAIQSLCDKLDFKERSVSNEIK